MVASFPPSDIDTEEDVTDPRRPSDHFDSPAPVVQPTLGVVGYLRFFWRQLTSMRTALFLLLLVAFAAVPGSLVPQMSSDPNGVIQFKATNPAWWVNTLDFLGVFSTYTSVWFSAIYLLLFISLIGCIIPRTMHHVAALRTQPPKTPARLERLAGFVSTDVGKDVDVAAAVAQAQQLLRRSGYRTRVFGDSVSAERGYLRETGNLVFHMALVGVLASVGIGGGFIWTAQKVVVVGQSVANTLSDYDSVSPGRWFNPDGLQPYSLKLTKFNAVYETKNVKAIGDPLDYTAYVTATVPGHKPTKETIKVNSPLHIGGTDVYLLGNGYAPVLTVRNTAGRIVFSQPVPFLAQDANLTSNGWVKIPIGLSKQLGMVGIFSPTECSPGTCPPIQDSIYPGLSNPVIRFQAWTGNLHLADGTPQNAFALDTAGMKEIAGFGSGKGAIVLKPGSTVKIPGGLGTISLGKSIPRYVSFDVHHDPTQFWVLTFAVLVFLGLITGLFIPRRRVWVKAVADAEGASFEYAGLARGEDARLNEAVLDIARRHSQLLGLNMKP
jgi:cytochrome c biogenesis protein